MRQYYSNQQIKDSTVSFLEEIVSVRSRKIWLTKQIRFAEEDLQELEERMERPVGRRWYLGDQITARDVKSAKYEVELLKDLRSNIK